MKRFLPLSLVALLAIATACRHEKESTATPTKLSQKDQEDFAYFYYTAGKEKILGNLEESAKLYRKCLQIDGKSAPALYELAGIFFGTGDSKNAEFLSKAATHFDPRNEWYQLLYADVLEKNKKYGEALKVHENLVKMYPERIDFYYDYATSLLYAGKFDEAVKVYDKLEKMVGVNEDISMQKQKVYIRQNKLGKAIEEIQKLIGAYPDEPRYYGMLAELYQANEMSEKALETYNKALKIDPGNPYIHLSLSDYYRQKNEKEKSFGELKAAFRSEQLDIDTKIKILLNYFNISEASETYKAQAYELLDIAVAVHPKEAKIFAMQGDYQVRDKKYKEARESYLEALKIDKDRIKIWEQVLSLDAELEDMGGLYEHSKEAMDLYPNESSFYLMNGIALIQKKNFKEAITVLKGGAALAVNEETKGQIYGRLGDAYYQEKQVDESDKAYDKALELNPNDAAVLNNYSYYLSLRKANLEKAEQMSKRANELDKNSPSNQDTYGWILYQMKRYPEAKEWIGKAVVGSENKNAVILEHYGDVLYQLGDKDQALEFWKNAKNAGKGSELLDKKISTKTLVE